ncbi:aldehyde dehydrogenase family protein [Bradyrhizobium neotropicale]|uniref:aldehyde dehydrogenase family protein n=1 Tax=Bradyrhizobium neotropicale TaxID=1497615 RepID=UPI001AD789D4|nr:aldehyde dehydrogenase family protein [Bradyrhizobium neotropicale]
MVDHPAIGSINFTGSVAAGRDFNQVATKSFKKVVVELGRKAPFIVFPDVDLTIFAPGLESSTKRLPNLLSYIAKSSNPILSLTRFVHANREAIHSPFRPGP